MNLDTYRDLLDDNPKDKLVYEYKGNFIGGGWYLMKCKKGIIVAQGPGDEKYLGKTQKNIYS